MKRLTYIPLMITAILGTGPVAPLGAQSTASVTATLEAASANVAEPGIPVRIELFRWSTEGERRALLAAFDPPEVLNPVPLPIPGSREEGGRGAAFAPTDPMEAFMAELSRAPTVGYLWTDEVVGYSVRYAHLVELADGSQQIWLLTNRRLGGSSPKWNLPSGAAPTDYPFTLLEARLNPSGAGSARASLAAPIVHDRTGGGLVLEAGDDAAVLENLRMSVALRD